MDLDTALYGWNLRASDLESLSTFVECDPTSLL